MKVFLVTRGSQGDILPYLAIGSELKKRGHEVLINLPPVFEKEVKAAGLDYLLHAPDDILDLMSDRHGLGAYTKWIRNVTNVQCKRLPPIVKQYDLMVSTNTELSSQSIAEYCGIPLILTTYAPIIPGHKIPPPQLPYPKPHPVFRPWLLWKLVHWGSHWMLMDTINANRKQLGLKPVSNFQEYIFSYPYNYCLYSPILGSTDPDWTWKWQIGGYCFNEELGYDREIGPEMMEFIRSDKRPLLFFTLGSCNDKHSKEFCKKLVEVCRRLDYRLLIGAGWSKTGEELQNSRHLYVMKDFVPHQLIFPYCDAVIHHGGCGTTHNVARAGKPQLLLPLIIDQPYWAYQLKKLGVGPDPVRIVNVTEEELSKKIRRLVTDSGYKERAAEIGAQLRRENGVAAFCDYVESFERK